MTRKKRKSTAPQFLQHLSREINNQRILFFAGKGGVGKTVIAGATGLYLSTLAKKKTLLYSVDPAHSLSDCFQIPIGNKVTNVSSNLYALEVNSKQEYGELKKKFLRSPDQSRIAGNQGFDLPFERKMFASFMNLSPPGIDELMALIKLVELVRSNEYETIIVDAAAGYHSIRLLELVGSFQDWLARLDSFFEQYRSFVRIDDLRAFASTLKKDLRYLDGLLRRKNSGRIVPVTTAEELSLDVAKDIVESAKSLNLSIGYVVANRVPFAEKQGSVLQKIRRCFPGLQIIVVPELPGSIFGKALVSEIAKTYLAGKKITEIVPGHSVTEAARGIQNHKTIAIPNESELLVFAGKGGCGKTTCAAATGVFLSRKGSRTLVYSSDPQRSLSMVFGQHLDGRITRIRDRLFALQIDPPRLLQSFRDSNRDAILEIILSGTYLTEAQASDLFELSFPGLDEVMGLIELSNLITAKQFDKIVLDTAPTGHALRLLETPELLSNWVKLFSNMRSKSKFIQEAFTGSVKRTRGDVFLAKLVRGIRMAKSIIHSDKASFFVVTTADQMAVNETLRLLSFLDKNSMRVSGIIVNKLAKEKFCSSSSPPSWFDSRGPNTNEAAESLAERPVVYVPSFESEPRGLRDLEKFANALYGD